MPAKTYNPATIHTPGAYSHGRELPANARILYVAGQLGLAPDGKLAGGDFRAQAERAWQNLFAVLADAGMEVGDLVKVNAYLTRRGDIETYREIRARVMGPHRPAATLLVIDALAHEGALIEIEAVAAKA